MTLFGLHNANTNVGLGGGLRHQLGGMFRIPHGEATCVMLPHVMRFNAPSIPDRYLRLARAMGLDTAGLAPDAVSDAVVQQIADLITQLDLPHRLEPLGVVRTDLDKMAEHVMQERSLQFNPRPISDRHEIVALLEAAL